MRIRSVPDFPVTVLFLDGYEEKQELNLRVRCMTPKQQIAFSEKVFDNGSDFHTLVKENCNVTTGWENVTDEEGNPVDYSPEKLADLQYDYFGLADSIALSISKEAKEQRKKRSLILDDLIPDQTTKSKKPKNQASSE